MLQLRITFYYYAYRNQPCITWHKFLTKENIYEIDKILVINQTFLYQLFIIAMAYVVPATVT